MSALFWRPNPTAYAEAVLADRIELATAETGAPAPIAGLMFGDIFAALQELAAEGSSLATVGGVPCTADCLGTVRRFAIRRNVPEPIALWLAVSFDRHAIPIHAAALAQMIRRDVDDLKRIGPPSPLP